MVPNRDLICRRIIGRRSGLISNHSLRRSTPIERSWLIGIDGEGGVIIGDRTSIIGHAQADIRAVVEGVLVSRQIPQRHVAIGKRMVELSEAAEGIAAVAQY